MKLLMPGVLVLFMLSAGLALGADRDLANGLAAAGAAHAAKGNYSQAKELLFKALANDDSCPDAVFELAKIFDKEGASAAGDFYQRATVLLAQDPKPANNTKRTEALARVKALNPFAPRFTNIFEEYALDLDKLVRKNPDSLTQDVALDEAESLKLPSLLTPDKLPKFFAAAEKEKADNLKAEKERKAAPKVAAGSGSHEKVGVTLPDVEKELKALGWATIKGQVLKKGPGIYELTDALLEAPKINGAIDFTVIKDANKGSMKATARSSFVSDTGSSSVFDTYSMPGFGFQYRTKDYTLYGPSLSMLRTTATVEPMSLGIYPMPDTPKVHFMLLINEGAFEFIVNDKRNQKANHNKTPKTGPFQIDVFGTLTLENPRCAGQ